LSHTTSCTSWKIEEGELGMWTAEKAEEERFLLHLSLEVTLR
jgi:hypothetical protein